MKDTVVVITGASRGIGYVTAQAFLSNGARVAVCSHSASNLVTAQEKLRHLGHVWAQPVDVRHAKQARAFVDGVLAQYGRIDVLVNNAGRAKGGQFVLESDAGIDEMIDVNVKGLLYVTHAVLPAMLRQRAVS